MNVWNGSVLSFFGLSAGGYDPGHSFWYEDVMPRTSGGVYVNESTALNYSVCWAATRLLAGTASWLPFNLYKRTPGGGAEIDTMHPVHRLLHDAPNDDMGSMMWRATGFNQQINRGNAFAEIVRDKGGRVVSLAPIHASHVPTKNIKRENGRLVYYVSVPGEPTQRIRQEDMFHVPSVISEDGIIGKGVVTAAREAIGKAISTQNYGAATLNNGGTPPLAIKGGKFRSKEDREEYRRQFAEAHGGPGNAGKPLLLPDGSEAQVLGFNLRDTQFIESQQFDIEEICRWYGVPPHLVGHLLRATFNNIEELGIVFVKYSLILWLKLWEQEVWRKLLTPAEKKTHYAKFVVDALERGNKEGRTNSNVQEFFNGLLTLNQWAEREDMNPIGPLGDLHFVQQAMVPLEIAAKGPVKPVQDEPRDTPGDEPQDEEPEDNSGGLNAQMVEMLASLSEGLASLRLVQVQAAKAHLRDVLSRMVSVELHAVKHIAEKPSRFDERLREFYDKHEAALNRNLLEPVSLYLTALGDAREPVEVLAATTAAHVAESLRQLDALTDCKLDELSGKVDACVSTWHDERVPLGLAQITEKVPCN